MPNHLVSENSPYLLQHANNPVDWYPWGEDQIKICSPMRLCFIAHNTRGVN